MVTGSEGIDMSCKLSRLLQSLCSILSCFLKFNEHQNHLEGLLEPKLLDFTSRVSVLVCGGAKEFACLTGSQVMLLLQPQDLSLSEHHCSEPSRDLWRDQRPSERIYSHPPELCRFSPSLQNAYSGDYSVFDKGRTHLTNIKWVSCRVKCFLDPCGLTQLKFLCSCILKTSVCISKQLTEKVGQPGMGADSWDEFV